MALPYKARVLFADGSVKTLRYKSEQEAKSHTAAMNKKFPATKQVYLGKVKARLARKARAVRSGRGLGIGTSDAKRLGTGFRMFRF